MRPSPTQGYELLTMSRKNANNENTFFKKKVIRFELI